jgi:hypothetical protein
MIWDFWGGRVVGVFRNFMILGWGFIGKRNELERSGRPEMR